MRYGMIYSIVIIHFMYYRFILLLHLFSASLAMIKQFWFWCYDRAAGLKNHNGHQKNTTTKRDKKRTGTTQLVRSPKGTKQFGLNWTGEGAKTNSMPVFVVVVVAVEHFRLLAWHLNGRTILLLLFGFNGTY